MFNTVLFGICIYLAFANVVQTQMGPDPWDLETVPGNVNNENVPPDLIAPVMKKQVQSISIVERFYRRILTIILKNGRVKEDKDLNKYNVKLEMNLSKDEWDMLESFLKSDKPLSEDMFRRSVGLIQEAIVKPTLKEIITISWNEYFHIYLIEYKMYLVGVLGASALISMFFFLRSRMSQRHLIMVIFVIIYLYEAFISYKEAEQQDYNKFISALSACKWQFWSSSCDIAPPDPLVFIKHMHPLKIGMRVISLLITEPMQAITTVANAMIAGVTDGLWYPLDKIVNITLMVFINLMLIMFLMIIMFNYILNIPFKFSLFAGMFSLGINQKKRNIVSMDQSEQENPSIQSKGDSLRGENLNQLFNICALALDKKNTPTNNKNRAKIKAIKHKSVIHKLARTGRLTDLVRLEEQSGIPRRRKMFEIGSGDGTMR